MEEKPKYQTYSIFIKFDFFIKEELRLKLEVSANKKITPGAKFCGFRSTFKCGYDKSVAQTIFIFEDDKDGIIDLIDQGDSDDLTNWMILVNSFCFNFIRDTDEFPDTFIFCDEKYRADHDKNYYKWMDKIYESY